MRINVNYNCKIITRLYVLNFKNTLFYIINIAVYKCKQRRIKGGLGHGPFGKKFFFDIVKKLKNLVCPPPRFV